jgi:hypothetical protein
MCSIPGFDGSHRLRVRPESITIGARDKIRIDE